MGVAGRKAQKQAERERVKKNVGLMRRLSHHLSGWSTVDSDSHKTSEFSARKTCVRKRTRIWDDQGRRNSAGCWELKSRLEIRGI